MGRGERSPDCLTLDRTIGVNKESRLKVLSSEEWSPCVSILGSVETDSLYETQSPDVHRFRIPNSRELWLFWAFTNSVITGHESETTPSGNVDSKSLMSLEFGL